MTPITTPSCQRTGQDRRQSAQPFHPHRLRGRRRQHRRLGDGPSQIQQLDWYQPRLLLLALGLMLLCIADAHNTLQLINAGAREVNPLMERLLQHDMYTFVFGKLAISALSVITLIAYHDYRLFNRLRIRHVIYTCLLLYGALISYQLSMWPGEETLLMFIRPEAIFALLPP